MPQCDVLYRLSLSPFSALDFAQCSACRPSLSPQSKCGIIVAHERSCISPQGTYAIIQPQFQPQPAILADDRLLRALWPEVIATGEAGRLSASVTARATGEAKGRPRSSPAKLSQVQVKSKSNPSQTLLSDVGETYPASIPRSPVTALESEM